MAVAGGRNAARMWGRESACGGQRSWPRNPRKTIPEVGEFRGGGSFVVSRGSRSGFGNCKGKMTQAARNVE